MPNSKQIFKLAQPHLKKVLITSCLLFVFKQQKKGLNHAGKYDEMPKRMISQPESILTASDTPKVIPYAIIIQSKTIQV